MALNQYQKRWLERKNLGLVDQNPICPICGKPCRSDSSQAPYHWKCWKTTFKGKEYLRKKKQESRERLKTSITRLGNL